MAVLVPVHPGRPGYIAVKPLTQYKGENPYGMPGNITYFKIDAAKVPVEIYASTSQGMEWRHYDEFLNDTRPKLPLIFEKVLDTANRQAIALELANSGMFKPKTEYITIGDEATGEGTIDLKTMLPEADYLTLKNYLTYMPRQMLREFFMSKIYPSIPFSGVFGNMKEGTLVSDPIYGGQFVYKSFQNLVWSGFVDMFNLANVEYINKNQVQPWDWEKQKTDAYYQSSNKEALLKLEDDISQYGDLGLNLDPKAVAIMEQFEKLPKLGDTGLEINRQSAIKELLKMQEYATAQAIVDAYRYIDSTEIGPFITKPIPGNIIGKGGEVLVQKSDPNQ